MNTRTNCLLERSNDKNGYKRDNKSRKRIDNQTIRTTDQYFDNQTNRKKVEDMANNKKNINNVKNK